MTLVMKFGGTSVGNAAAIRQTAALIRECKQEWGELLVVASAIGSKPVKVTDLLLTGAYAAAAGESETVKQVATQLRQIHFAAIDELLHPEGERQTILAENQRFVNHYVALCEAVQVLGELTPRALDAIGGMGEQMATRILAAYLRQDRQPATAIDATELIVTDNHFQSATPLLALSTPKSGARLRPLLTQNIIPIVTGFIGANEDGITTTLGRGGSDYSAAILGQALQAQEVWIWTDVDGVMTADPRLVSNAQSIPTLSFREVSELAYFGAQVLHPKTMRPCVENGIPLRIKNTFHPQHPGTVIVADSHNGRGSIKAVTAIKDLAMITVEGRGMMGVPGIAARTFGAVAQIGVSVLLIAQASSEQSICFITPAKSAPAVVDSLESALNDELNRQDIDRVWAQSDLSIITVVGAGMQGTPGIAGRIFTALGDNQVNVIAIAQGSSECSISLVVQTPDVAAAVQHIHQLII